jgi:D-lactate dehydrogenase (cytochrome)
MIYAFGHAGDGNILSTLRRMSRRAALASKPGARDILKQALELEDTIRENGIGYLKRGFLSMELSPESIRLQKKIKDIFDSPTYSQSRKNLLADRDRIRGVIVDQRGVR